MARKLTKIQKAAAKKYGVRVTKSVRGKRVELSPSVVKSRIATAKSKAAKKKVATKKKSSSKRQIPVKNYSKSADKRIEASTKAGGRKSKKYATITYVTKDGKRKVRRRNANQFGKAQGGKRYTERRENRTDKGKYL